jgi:hypothetical protein
MIRQLNQIEKKTNQIIKKTVIKLQEDKNPPISK